MVTALQMRLYPVTQVYGGNLLYPPEMARAVMQHYRQWVASAPDELTSSIALMNLPPVPEVPEPLRGKSVVMVRGCYTGDTAAGEALLAHWRNWQAPIMDLWGEMPFIQMPSISMDPVDPLPSKHSGAWMSDLSDAAIDTLVQYAFPPGGPPPLLMVETRHFGGAVTRVPSDANAFSHRDAAFLLFLVGVAINPEVYAVQVAHIDALFTDLQPSLTGGVYMNFLGFEASQRAKDGFSPEAYQRLRALKTQVDPENRFPFGHIN